MMQHSEDTHLIVVYDFEYTSKNGRRIQITCGEKLYLIHKTNGDWWQVIRSCEEGPFHVPAMYVCEPKRKQETTTTATADYQNLDNIERPIKPVPKTRTKLKTTDNENNDSDSSHSSERLDNRMKNSYNLKIERKQSVPLSKKKPIELGKNLSRSLEKLAEEIKFEPRIRGCDNSPKAANQETTATVKEKKLEKEAKNHQNKAAAKMEKTEDKGFFRASLRGKPHDLIPHDNAEKKNSMRGKSSDASIVLNERKPTTTKSRGLFSSFKRKKEAFVLSSSWEGLDKITEIADKPMVTAFGLQRSKTFMTPERPKPRTRLDAYKPNPTWTVSSFKPDVPAVTKQPPFATRKASLVRNRRVDSTKSRLRVPASPPPDESPIRELGDGWGEFQSTDGRPYFFNRITGERNLKPPRKPTNLQISGSKDSISSDLSSPVRSSPSPKFSSGTSLDRLTPPKNSSRHSLDRLTPIEMPPLSTFGAAGGGPVIPPSEKPPFDPEEIEALDRLNEVIPDGWIEQYETKDGSNNPRRSFIHSKTKQKYSTWPSMADKPKLKCSYSLTSVFMDWLVNCNYDEERKDAIQDSGGSGDGDKWVRSIEPVSQCSLLPPTYQDVFKPLLDAIAAEIVEIEMMADPVPDFVQAESLERFVTDVSVEQGIEAKIDTIFDGGKRKEKPPVPPRRLKREPTPETDSELALLQRTTELTITRRKQWLERKASSDHFFPREDVIIEWSDHLDGFQEPVLLEGKTVPKYASDSSVDLSEWDSDENNEIRSDSWNLSHLHRPLNEHDLKQWCPTANYADNDFTDLKKNKMAGLSKSLDHFDFKLNQQQWDCSHLYQQSVNAWLGYIRFAPYEESVQWYAANDADDRIYFYHEHSNMSRWQLPDLPDPPKDFGIQRSATDTAIPLESETRLRRTLKEDLKERSAKAQSMHLDARDLPPGNGKLLNYREKIHGSLNRAKILDCGKRIRKNWISTFAVLDENIIYFFKDEKTCQQMQKNVVPSKGSYVSHCLTGAKIEPATNASGRKNAYKISWPETEILIQTDKTDDAEKWVRDIKYAINNIPSTRKDSSESLDQSASHKIQRSKSVKTKTKDSNEELNNSGGKNYISEILKKFISKRPSSDVLRQKGILEDEPVFGSSLDKLTIQRPNRIPQFVERCVEVIESNEENMKTDGLYRASGNLSQVQKIRLKVDQNNLDILEQEEDVHVLTGSLKLFFRELKEPLIPSNLIEKALSAIQHNSKVAKEFKQIVTMLPEPNRATLRFLLEHLLRVEKLKEFNRMTFSNLAIVFGPTLMFPAASEDSHYMAMHLMQQNEVIEALLSRFHDIFV